jgi:hypothetical protein
MRIGLDLDGVLCDTDTNYVRLCVGIPPYDADMEKRKEMEKVYFSSRNLLLNPEDFVDEVDEYFVITGRDEEVMGEVTRKWCRKYVPNAKDILVGEYWKPVKDAKAKKIIELDLDVYFDDDPSIVKALREVLPERIKVIHYGGRWIK